MNIIAAMDDPNVFGPWFVGTSWDPWRTVLKAAFALPMSPEEAAFFSTIAERQPPQQRVRELWIVAGRRAGKDSIASVIAAHAAALFDSQDALRPGERALAMCLACDRDQAKIVLGYVRSFFNDNEMLRRMVTRDTAAGLELENCVDIAVGTNSFRAVRGRAVLLAILDECAYYRDETSATPDEELYRAIGPSAPNPRCTHAFCVSSNRKPSQIASHRLSSSSEPQGRIRIWSKGRIACPSVRRATPPHHGAGGSKPSAPIRMHQRLRRRFK
jgi:hypothetical protein